MQEQENTKIAQQAYENFKSGDIQALLSLLSDDVEWQLPNMDNVPFSGTRRGREQVSEFFASLDRTQEALEFEPKEFIAQGDTVVALGRYRWRVKPTGREFEGDWAHVFTLRDGRIVRFREYTDTAAAITAHQRAQGA